MKLSTEHIDSDSRRSPSDDEQRLGAKEQVFETLGHGGLPPDPDAHLSVEERAAIVCSHCPRPAYPFISPVSMADFLRVGQQTRS